MKKGGRDWNSRGPVPIRIIPSGVFDVFVTLKALKSLLILDTFYDRLFIEFVRLLTNDRTELGDFTFLPCS